MDPEGSPKRTFVVAGGRQIVIVFQGLSDFNLFALTNTQKGYDRTLSGYWSQSLHALIHNIFAEHSENVGAYCKNVKQPQCWIRMTEN